MFEFMTNTVILTHFIFIVLLDAYMALKAICWVFGKLRDKK